MPSVKTRVNNFEKTQILLNYTGSPYISKPLTCPYKKLLTFCDISGKVFCDIFR